MLIAMKKGDKFVDYEQIRLEKQDRVAKIFLNRPERLNAWTAQMGAELSDAVTNCNNDPEIGAMIISGEGRAFCAGADIENVFKAKLDGNPDKNEGAPATNWGALLRQSKPVIAAVNGVSVGIGATCILPADVIIASTEAKFGMVFVKMGLVPELASSHFLIQRLGFGRAHEMCLTGKLYSGQEAFEMGLADHVVEHNCLLDKAMEIASLMAKNPSTQARWIKQLLTDNGCETDLDEVMAREGSFLEKATASPEHKEAVSAFMEKRPADFLKASNRS